MKNSLIQLFCSLFSLGILLVVPSVSNAQIDTSSKIIIHVPSNPSLSEGRKLEILPQISRNKIEQAPLKFVTIDKFTTTEKHVNVLPPITFAPEKKEILPNGYASLGYGNLNAWNGNLYLANNSSPTNAYGFKYNHFSLNEKGTFKDFSRNEVGAFTKLYKGSEEFGIAFDYSRLALRFFNLPDSVEVADRKELTRTMEQWNLNTYYKFGNINQTGRKPYVRLDFDFDRFNLNMNRFENSFQGKVHFRKDHKGFGLSKSKDRQTLDLLLKTHIDQVRLSADLQLTRVFAWLEARDQFAVDLGKNTLTVDFGLNLGVFADTTQPKLFPNLYANAQLPIMDKRVILIAGVDGGYEKQGLQSLFTNNPFIQNIPLLENKYTNLRLFAGINAKVAPGANFVAEVSHATISNLPLFVASSDSFRRFDVVYDNVGLTTIKGQLNFSMGEKIWANLIAAYYNYNMETEQNAWMYADFETKLRLHYILSKKLFIKTDLLMMGNRSARLEDMSSLELKPLVDINLGVDYHFKKMFFAFVQLNNIAGATYQRWYNFPVYGFNANAGVGIRF
jgi:hypothetical protein